MRLSTRIPTSQQLRKLESAWIDTCHTDWGLVLMEVAGRHAAEQAVSMWQEGSGEVVILCGRGNNGGDGLVVARYLKLWGVPVSVYMVEGQQKKPSDTRSESAVNKAIAEKIGLKVEMVSAGNLSAVTAAVERASLIVDALLGTGLDRPVEGVIGELIDLANRSGKQILAIDVPSGINSDTGQVMADAVLADATVTFGYLKAGLLHYPGAAHCGKITLIDIGLPGFDQNQAGAGGGPHWWLTTAEWVRSRLPDRPDDAHKGLFGHLLTIAGSTGMSGASILASKGALRAGAGLSILATAKSLLMQLPPQEVIYRGLPETPEGSISSDAFKNITEQLDAFSAVILGPGLSLNADTVKLVHKLLPAINKTCVLDADALNAVAQEPGVFPKSAAHFILTPHPKELSRLLGLSVSEIQSDRIAAATKAAMRFGCTVILKGSRTVVASPDERIHINPTGNSGMATAGSGDVLSGIIGGLAAQGLSPFEAAVAGVYIHGAAGDLAAQEIGGAGIVAGDIMAFVPTVISGLHNDEFQGSALEVELFGS